MSLFRATPRPCRGGIVLKLLLAMAVVLVAGAIAWVVLLPSIVASTIHSRTGFTVKIDRLTVNPLTASFHLTGFVLQNPPGWPEPDFLNVREFKADAHVFPLLAGRFVADEVVADIASITLVRNQQGSLNSLAFANGLGGGKSTASAPPPTAQAPAAGKGKGFLIHHLTLKLDQIVYADYGGRTPVVKKIDVHLNQQMTEVDSVAKLISPLTGSALGLAANAFGGLSPKDADLLSGALNTLQGAGKKAGESLKNLFRSLDNKKP